MPDAQILSMPLPDQVARTRIATDLETNLMVEAGAGSGKTTALVGRMAALVSAGAAKVQDLAAVTFTRKSAGELRERFQAHVERLIAEPETPDDERSRLRTALDDLDRAFVGTIHSFCARLLRERPLDVGLDPGFQEIPVEERVAFRRRYWDAYLERLARESDPLLEDLSAAGLRPGQLFGLFERMVENPDVRFPSDDAVSPTVQEIAAVRAELEEITGHGVELMPEIEPERGWDSLQKKIRSLAFTREVTGWREPADFFEALEQIGKPGPRGHQVTQKRWKDGAMAKAFCARVDRFAVGPDAPGNAVLNRWYAHRYGLAIRLCGHAAETFAEHRRRIGRLDFQDLLVHAARLLRDVPGARADLGQRYRRLLVDEFQDTDPLQAEIMLLLASEPVGESGEPDDEFPVVVPDWRTVEPRPGALFVVGDPKQSIYRFRRADILLYELVKRRFRDFGTVVELTSNFRSRPPIGDLVNQLFAAPDFFPPEANAVQARFEPLNTRPGAVQLPAEGVFHYELDPAGSSRASVADDDAGRLATWIADRVERREREPGDFMVLTRTTHYLSSYARALEARGIPIQVTGAGVGVEEELQELMALLECMIDPSNPVKVVTVLVGLFFGLDLERLTRHRLDRGSLDVMDPGTSGDPDVLDALRILHGWWRAATVEPADIFVGARIAELGLLPFAAAGELGSLRAGALVYALDAVRAAALAGDASLPGALDALRGALDLREAEAPLEPARPDVVRLMNLHQAKGLEATVVVLADPSKSSDGTVEIHVERGDDGVAIGHLCVFERGEGFRGNRLLARPLAWEEKERQERAFEEAERVRLLYVAATRARDELVVSRWSAGKGASNWAALDPWLNANGSPLPLEARSPEPRPVLEYGRAEALKATRAAAQRLREMAEESFRHVSVTEVAKAEDIPPAPTTPPDTARAVGAEQQFRGYSWGSVVHAALAAAAAGLGETGLLAVCRALLLEHDRPVDDHGNPVESQELMDLVHSVRTSDLWLRAESSERMLVEVPFAVPGSTRPPPPAPPPETVRTHTHRGGERRQLDLFGGDSREVGTAAGPPMEAVEAGTPSVLEGVIDLVFREDDGWVVADYKTDIGTDPHFGERVVAYRRQVELYAAAWARLTGEPVKERVLFFTNQGTVETW